MSCGKFKISNMNKPWMIFFAFETTNTSQGKLDLPANKEPQVNSDTMSYAGRGLLLILVNAPRGFFRGTLVSPSPKNICRILLLLGIW